MKSAIIRTGGFGLYFTLLVASCFILLAYFCAVEIFLHFSIVSLIGFLFCLWLVASLIVYIFGNRIELECDSISIRTANPFQYRAKTICLKISEVSSIYLGKRQYLGDLLRGKKVCIDELNRFYNKYKANGPAIAASIAVNYSAIFVLLTKDDQITIVSTKPFSKSDFRRLFIELRKTDIDLSVERNTL